jgi:hypothetical protein
LSDQIPSDRKRAQGANDIRQQEGVLPAMLQESKTIPPDGSKKTDHAEKTSEKLKSVKTAK